MKRNLPTPPPLRTAIQAENPPHEQEARELRARLLLAVLALALGALCVSRSAFSADNPDKQADRAYNDRLQKERQAAEQRDRENNARTAEEKEAVRKQAQAAKDKIEKQQNLAEYKEKTINNLASIKEMDVKAEAAWKEKHYGEASAYYTSISLANVPGAEPLSEKARGRLVELEDVAKATLKAADDADLNRDYNKEVELLSTISKDFRQTKTRETALRRLLALKSKPEVAGFVELAQAEALEADGKTMEAVNLYTSIAANPRYEHSIPAIKSARRLEEMNKSDATRAKIKAEVDARAEKEAPILLASARNFVSNNMPKQAIEKLQQVVEKFPETTYAEQARKQIEDLKN